MPSHPTQRLIGQRLAAARKARDLNQAEVAAKLGVATNSVSRWETGTTKIDCLDLVRLSNLYGVSADYMLGLADPGAGLHARPERFVFVDHEAIEAIRAASSADDVAAYFDYGIEWAVGVESNWELVSEERYNELKTELDERIAKLGAYHVKWLRRRLEERHESSRGDK